MGRSSEQHGESMDEADVFARAAPECRHCGERVQRVELPWHLDEDGRWRLGPSFMVCRDGHRVMVEPL
mgnify:CR=1 FL=1